MRLRRTALPCFMLGTAAWLFSVAAYAQDQQPSLGDVARQARKDKEKNSSAPKKVITDDDLSSTKALSGLGDFSNSPTPGGTSSPSKALAALTQIEGTLDKLEPMDRATLAKAVLLDHDVDFTGRGEWENKLFAAKQEYVSHGRELLHQMKQLVTEAQSLKASQTGQAKLSPNDPRVQEFVRKLQELVQDAVRTDSAYQAVVMEGWDRAKQAKP